MLSDEFDLNRWLDQHQDDHGEGLGYDKDGE